MAADGRVIGFNAGILLVAVSVPLPWADVAGDPRSGPSFANLLLSLPDIPRLGSHLTMVAAVWWSIPFLALAAWTTQFRNWPPRLDGWTRLLAVPLLLSTLLMVAWLAVRDVGFPSVGAVLAGAGAVLVAAVALAPPRRSPGPLAASE
jgi:hypothetical protein